MNIKKFSELVEDIRTDLEILNSGYDIEKMMRASDRLVVNAKEMRRRASKFNDGYKWVAKLERYGF